MSREDDSQAARRYREIEPDGPPDGNDQLALRLRSEGALRPEEGWPSSLGTVFGAALPAALQDARAALIDGFAGLGFDRARLDRIVVGLTISDEFTARLVRFPDDTGLVLVADSVVAMCGAYCRYRGTVFGADGAGLARLLFRLLKARITGRTDDPVALTHALRMHNVGRRAFGISAMPGLVRPGGGPLVDDFLLEQALRFTIGHEIAHHLLDHDGGAHLGFSVAEDLATSDVADDREAAADMLALLVSAESMVDWLGDEMRGRWLSPNARHSREAAEFVGLLGALLAMVAVHSTESALFVRRGTTHVPARTRASLLVNHMLSDERLRSLERAVGGPDWRVTDRFEVDRGTVDMMMCDVLVATEAAGRFAADGPTLDWARFPRLAGVEQPPPRYVRHIARLDAVMCETDPSLVEIISTAADGAGGAAGTGARLARAGRTRDAMTTWGLPAETVERLHDENRALAFHTLVANLRRGSVLKASREVAVAAATLVARRIDGVDPAETPAEGASTIE